MTHREAPWRDARGDLPAGAPCSTAITDVAMRAVSSPPQPDQTLRFLFGRLDHDKWALCKIDRKHHKRLLDRLAYFEKMTMAQARFNDLLADYDMADCPNKRPGPGSTINTTAKIRCAG